MVAKFGEARRQAFFKALRETGNRTLAAEAAKVSQSWVTLHRGQDPEFRRKMEECVAEAKARLSAHGERQPPSGWGFLDGCELVVRGTNGRRVQIARARLKQWTPRIEDRFLAALSATANVAAAYSEVGMSKSSAYGHRNRWAGFGRRWDKAVELAAIRLEFALVEHAGNPFSAPELPAPADLTIVRARPPGQGPGDVERGFALTFDEGMHGLYMTQHRLHGIGGRPGRCPDPARHDERVGEAVRAVLRNVDAIERAEALSEADKARDRAEYAARRDRPALSRGWRAPARPPAGS